MKLLHFENYNELANHVSDTFTSFEYAFNDISIIAKYNEAKEILKGLICIGYDIHSINLESEEIDDYIDEYIISILSIEGETSIWCEKFKRENRYINEESTIIYILDNCSSKVIPHLKADCIYEVCIGDNMDNQGDNDFEDVLNDSAEDVHGFSISKTDNNGYYSYSFYTSEKLDKNDIEDILAKFGYLF